MKLFLLESEATVIVTDMLGFHALADGMDAMELGVVLSSFYEHIGAVIERHEGRIAKFIGDGVLAAYEGAHHRDRALGAVLELTEARAGWLAESARVHLPAMDYSLGVATGGVLTGEMGTERVHFWDVIGAPVNLAFRLCALATDRKLPHLLDAETLQGVGPALRGRALELDAAELGGKRHRLYRLDT